MKLVLSENRRLRFAVGAMMYFAQGIPQGLLGIAIPAWLASKGVGAGEIASYLAVIILPWAFKLVTGPFMDRYQYLPMGRRKLWVVGAQLGLVLSLLSLMLIKDPVEQLGLLMLLGVIINSFAATQDVAVDGMAIDLTPVREQGRLNAFMSFGKALGWSGTAAVSGALLVTAGIAVTAVVAAFVASLALLLFVLVLEREGERRLPWTAGGAVVGKQAAGSFRDVFRGVNAVLWTRASVVVLGIMFVDGLVSGYGHALMPVAAINVFAYTTSSWSQLVAVMGFTGAIVSLGIGPMIDRFGAKKMLIFTAVLVGIHALLLAQTQAMWVDTTYVRVMLSVWVMMVPVVMVCAIALAMSACNSKCSATQFAIYMSTANLGHAMGSKLFGVLSERTYDENYTIMAALTLVLVVILFLHRQKQLNDEQQRRSALRSVAVGGGGGGVFFSGAMRCPKCRSDMDTVTYEGVEVDRCERCSGVWFDVGEMEALKNVQAAKAIDTGSAKQGRQFNAVDVYRCPRCGGEMCKVTDPGQTHIWFETCKDCEGSFFDAGEFRDLSRVTLTDFFRDLVTPARN